MTFAPYGNIDLKPIFDFLKVLDLDQMYSFELGKYMYKIHHNLVPAHCLGNYFEPHPYVNKHSYGLRSRSANVPTRLVCHKKFSEKSTQISGEKFWRKIPIDIRNSESLNIFKNSFKSFVVEEPNDDSNDFIFSQ